MKKLVCILTLFSLLMGLLCQATPKGQAKEKLNGECGENATWQYSHETKTLTIFGTGAITSAEWDDEKWYSYYKDHEIEKVVIEEGITSIAKYMFNLGPMKEVSLPDTLTEIGKGAFSNCYYMEKINIPNSVKKIGSQAFFGCYSLKRLTFFEGVEIIGKNALKYCRDLTYLKLPSSLTTDADELGIQTIRSLRKVVNRTRYDISVKNYRKRITWEINGKKAKKIKAGKTAISTGKTYTISYQLKGAKIKGKKITSYRYGDVVNIDTTATKKNGYFFWWDTAKQQDKFYLGGYDVIEGERPATGNVILKPCFFYCTKKRINKRTVTLKIDASEIADEGDSVIIRYCTSKTDMSNAKWKALHKEKGTMKLKNLEKGKTYYFGVRVCSSDSDWDEDIDEDILEKKGWTLLGGIK